MVVILCFIFMGMGVNYMRALNSVAMGEKCNPSYIESEEEE